MHAHFSCRLSRVLAALVLVGEVSSGAEIRFQHHFIDRILPVTDKLVGDYGLTALVDLDRDGDLDFISCGRPFGLSRLYWFEFQATDRWVRHLVGTNYLYIVLDAKLGGHEFQVGDVDDDSDIDICSKAWGPLPWNALGGKIHVDFLENLIKSPKLAVK
jgi:hypothetical protein